VARLADNAPAAFGRFPAGALHLLRANDLISGVSGQNVLAAGSCRAFSSGGY